MTELPINQIIQGDCLEVMRGWPDESIQCVITSPPYWGLRDYGVDGQLGLEKTPEEYVAKMTMVFREVRRVLKSDGTMWLNLGDSYSAGKCGRDDSGDNGRFGGPRLSPTQRSAPDGLKPKDLVGIPWLLAFALRADGWYLRSDIIWSKPNPMPESVTDRPTKSHEYIFLMTKSARYYYDAKAIAEPASLDSKITRPDGWATGKDHSAVGHSRRERGGSRPHEGFNGDWDNRTKAEQCSGTRNKRSVWNIATRPFPDAHFATFPPDLVKVCLMAGSKVGDVICDPFMGSGTVAAVAKNAGRQYCGIELNPAYIEMAEKRLKQEVMAL